MATTQIVVVPFLTITILTCVAVAQWSCVVTTQIVVVPFHTIPIIKHAVVEIYQHAIVVHRPLVVVPHLTVPILKYVAMKLLVLKAGILDAAMGRHYMTIRPNHVALGRWYQEAVVSCAAMVFLSAVRIIYAVVEKLFYEVMVGLAAAIQFMIVSLIYVALTRWCQ